MPGGNIGAGQNQIRMLSDFLGDFFGSKTGKDDNSQPQGSDLPAQKPQILLQQRFSAGEGNAFNVKFIPGISDYSGEPGQGTEVTGAERLELGVYASGTFQEAALKPDAAPCEGAFDGGTEFDVSNIEQGFVSHGETASFNWSREVSI